MNFTITKAATAQQGVQFTDTIGIINYRNSLPAAMFEISKLMHENGTGTYSISVTNGVTGDSATAYAFDIQILNGAGVVLTDNASKKYSCAAQGQDNGMGAACNTISRCMMSNNGTYTITVTKE